MKIYSVIVLLLTLGLTACEDGPAEQFGEELDRAAQDVGNAVEDACEELSNRPC